MPPAPSDPPADPFALADWRRRVGALYAEVRAAAAGGPAARRAAWGRFWTERDRLFREHPQSPLDPADRPGHAGVPRFPWNPAARVEARVLPPPDREPLRIELAGDGAFTMVPAAVLAFELGGAALELTLYRIAGYGGGLFLPFGDATNGRSGAGDGTERLGSYGGGRYLIDTVKRADPGLPGPAAGGGPDRGPRAVDLDFNYAYHPSCAYSPRWDCPLAPPANRLPVAVAAGEAHRG